MIWLIIIIILVVLIMKASATTLRFDPKVAENVYKKWNNLALKYDAVAFPQNSLVSVYDILAIICVESAGNPNAIGDEGKSFGLMQVSVPALIDVNKSLGTNYTQQHLLIPEINVKIGSHYLQLCFKRAVQEKAKDIKFLGYRKYNAGIGRATEKNTISTHYAKVVLQYREYLKQIGSK